MAIVINRPNGIAIFQLKASMSAIRLEMKGMKHSRGSVRKHWALSLGLPARTKGQDVLDAMQVMVDEIVAKGDLGISQV